MSGWRANPARDVGLCILPVMAILDTNFNATYSIRCTSFTRYVFHLFRCLLWGGHLILVDIEVSIGERFETKEPSSINDQ